jgi:hypothetical protein
MKSLITGLTVGLMLAVVGVGCHGEGTEPASTAMSRAVPQAPSDRVPQATPAPKTSPTPETAPTQLPPPNEVGVATKAFLDRIQEYVTYHNNVEKMVPALKETSDPAKLSAREKALGEALIKQRPDAKQGDFFIKEYQPILRKLIHDDFAKRSAADRRALLVELPKGTTIAVNAVYPTSLPLATFPANLLKALPELPPELEYRMVGRDLVLRDVTGNVVVDVLPNAFPISS